MRPFYLALVLSLTACGGSDDPSGDTAAATTPEPSPKKPKPQPDPEPTTTSTVPFDHDAVFPLTYAHAVPCETCHGAGDPGPLDPTCSACHEDDRPVGHFDGTDCAGCHTPDTWAP